MVVIGVVLAETDALTRRNDEVSTLSLQADSTTLQVLMTARRKVPLPDDHGSSVAKGPYRECPFS